MKNFEKNFKKSEPNKIEPFKLANPSSTNSS